MLFSLSLYLCHDNYYRAHDDLTYEQRCRLNYDHPDAFDSDLMAEQLRRLKAGEAVECPTYDYTQHNRAAATVTVQPARVIVVEGILILADAALREQMDIRIFVDTDADVRILRRI
ncbi:MAG: uridine kinase, partial [Alistipes sp.]|nr:uridine kinase [Alistipes sp.]